MIIKINLKIKVHFKSLYLYLFLKCFLVKRFFPQVALNEIAKYFQQDKKKFAK